MPSGPGLDLLPPVHPAGAPLAWPGSLKSPRGPATHPLASPDPLDTTAGPVRGGQMDADVSAPLVPPRGPAPRMTSGGTAGSSVGQLARTRQSQGHSPSLGSCSAVTRAPHAHPRVLDLPSRARLLCWAPMPEQGPEGKGSAEQCKWAVGRLKPCGTGPSGPLRDRQGDIQRTGWAGTPAGLRAGSLHLLAP